jgi:hypothetical protein
MYLIFSIRPLRDCERVQTGLPDHLVHLEEQGQGDCQVEDPGGPLTPHRLCLKSQK